MNDFDFFKKEHHKLNKELSFEGKTVDDYNEEIEQILDGTYIKPISSGVDRLDAHFNMFYGMLLLVTGYPQSGKSEFVRFMACVHVTRGRGKVSMFSPESDTPILMMETINTCKHILGCAFNEAKEFVNEWFEFKEIRDNKGMPDINDLMNNFDDLSIQGYNFFVIDPMNWVTSSLYTNSGSFEGLRLTLTYLKQFAKRTKSIAVYVEHPKTPIPNKDGEYPPCTIFSVNGGVMHNNKIDAGLILHRERTIGANGKAQSTESDPILIEVAKLKMQRYLGKPSSIHLTYDFKTGMYY